MSPPQEQEMEESQTLPPATHSASLPMNSGDGEQVSPGGERAPSMRKPTVKKTHTQSTLTSQNKPAGQVRPFYLCIRVLQGNRAS